jgi:hypothetical protein
LKPPLPVPSSELASHCLPPALGVPHE